MKIAEPLCSLQEDGVKTRSERDLSQSLLTRK